MGERAGAPGRARLRIMIAWQDEAYVLSVRKHGETAAIVTVLSREHGRYAGLVHGGAGTRRHGTVQPGNRVAVEWRARLAEHLGTLSCEVVRAHAAEVLDDPPRLSALSAACALVEAGLPEREAHRALFDAMAAFIGHLGEPGWPSAYVRFELALLAELGYGLDLGSCAATGETENLLYVSPRSGRAVSREAGESYRDRLLALPAFLAASGGEGTAAEIAAGLALTGHFLERHALAPHGRTLPAARTRLVASLGKAARAG